MVLGIGQRLEVCAKKICSFPNICTNLCYKHVYRRAAALSLATM